MALIQIEENSGIPKYKQIIASIEQAIENGDLQKGDQLPSLNRVKIRLSLSRDTVLMAFNDLKLRGIIHSISGKGYYVKSDEINRKQRVFLLFDELNAFKEDLYNSFLTNLTHNIDVDIFFHHFNIDVFNKLIHDNIGNYNAYIIMPANLKNTHKSIEYLPHDRVYILDQTHPELYQYPAIYQNFKKDIYNALSEGYFLIKKYEQINLIYSQKKEPLGMLHGFQLFCKNYGIKNSITSHIHDSIINPGEVYLVPDDRDLIVLIKKIKEQQLKIGIDIGIISYNDTPLKEIVINGITTISTNFKQMGLQLAEMIIKKETKNIENSTTLIIRNSL